tara:strand:+ start:911 stop:1309 length:399 start_codon:yes stop_codon:yes gene_type:complete
MTKKKTLKQQQEDQERLTPRITAINILPIADSLLDEWRAYLNTEGELLLGRELSIAQALILQLQEAVQVRSETYALALETITDCRKEIEKLRKGYNDLCSKTNKDTATLAIITKRQKDFIDESNEKLRRLGL